MDGFFVTTMSLLAATLVFGLWTMFHLNRRHGFCYTWKMLSAGDKLMYCITMALSAAFFISLVVWGVCAGGKPVQ